MSPPEGAQDAPLSAELAQFLRDHVESYEHLLLLLLLQSEPARQFEVDELSSSLRLPAELVSGALDALARGALLETSPAGRRYRFAPADPRQGELARALDATYAKQPALIMQTLSANAIRRMRTGALHAFANAFVLRKDKENG